MLESKSILRIEAPKPRRSSKKRMRIIIAKTGKIFFEVFERKIFVSSEEIIRSKITNIAKPASVVIKSETGVEQSPHAKEDEKFAGFVNAPFKFVKSLKM